MNRNIALIRYRRFEGDLLLLEQLTSASAKTQNAPSRRPPAAAPSRTTRRSPNSWPKRRRNCSTSIMLSDFCRHWAMMSKRRRLPITSPFAASRISPASNCATRSQAAGFRQGRPDLDRAGTGLHPRCHSIGHFGTGDLEITITNLPTSKRPSP